MRNLIDGILKSWAFGELKNEAKKHSCEVIPALFFSFHWIQKYTHERVYLHSSGDTGKRVYTQDECFNESGTECKIT